MKALVMRAPGEYGVEDVKKPVPGFQEVLVRMHSVAICGSDPPLLAGESLKDGLPAYMPFIPGHEGAGVVEAAGSGVTDFKPGDMVAAEAHLGCGHCANCRMGRYNLCLNFGSRDISSMALPPRDAMPNTASITYGPSIIFLTA